MTRRFRTLSATATVTATLLASAAVAQATQPDKQTIPFAGTIENWVECPDQGFNIRIDFYGTDTYKTFYDQAGNITRITDHSYGTGTLTNQSDPSKTETGSSPTNLTADFINGTFTINGMSLHNNIPGLGRVAQDNGTITFPLSSFDPQTGDFTVDFSQVLHSGGPHPGFEGVDWCAMVA